MKVSFFNSKKIADLLRKNWLQVLLWSITCILLIIEIALLVTWQTSMNGSYLNGILNDKGEEMKNLTTEAIFQQNIISALAFTFVIALSISIFTTVIISYKNKKK